MIWEQEKNTQKVLHSYRMKESLKKKNPHDGLLCSYTNKNHTPVKINGAYFPMIFGLRNPRHSGKKNRQKKVYLDTYVVACMSRFIGSEGMAHNRFLSRSKAVGVVLHNAGVLLLRGLVPRKLILRGEYSNRDQNTVRN